MRPTTLQQHAQFGRAAPEAVPAAHARWVRILHWTGAASIITLVFSGFVVSGKLESE